MYHPSIPLKHLTVSHLMHVTAGMFNVNAWKCFVEWNPTSNETTWKILFFFFFVVQWNSWYAHCPYFTLVEFELLFSCWIETHIRFFFWCCCYFSFRRWRRRRHAPLELRPTRFTLPINIRKCSQFDLISTDPSKPTVNFIALL